uniref:Reverse transcriptase domain-containing protein n=1 Tax=Rhodnius prolixus TaxID=13249 RepID=T1H9V3_RHOPR
MASKKLQQEVNYGEEEFFIKMSNLLDSKMATLVEQHIVRIEGKIDTLISENNNLNKEILSLKEENKVIKNNLQVLLRKSKAKTLIIGGLGGVKEGNYLNSVQEFFSKVLGVSDIMIDRVFLIREGKLVVVELLKVSDVQQILRNVNKLKGTGIWINKDLSYQDRGSHWREDFEGVYDFVSNCQVNIVIVGDLNIRIGNAQIVPAEIIESKSKVNVERSSKDKVVNSKGKMFLELCDNYNCLVLNGRTQGDLCGEFTYVGGQGCSVNDICAVSYALLDRIYDFKVIPKLFSDHMPICLTLNLNIQFKKDLLLPLLPKLQWTTIDKHNFKNKLEESAFDSPDRNHLYCKLYNLGLSTKFINVLQGLYRNTESSVWTVDGVTSSFPTGTGLKQGCLLSPMLFLCS